MKKVKCYAYSRFSSAEQKSGDSLKRQSRNFQKFLKTHPEYELDESINLVDEGKSGYHGLNLREGGALHAFLELIRADKIEKGSLLLIENLDRLSRQKVLKVLDLMREIIEYDVNICTVSDGEVYTKESIEDTLSLFKIIIIAERAHAESLRKSQMIGQAWEQKRVDLRDKDKPYTKLLPFWLRWENGKIEPIPERIQLIEQIFKWAVDGHGKVWISKQLNQKSIPAFRGGRWNTSSIKFLLQNQQLIGLYQVCKKVKGKRVSDGEVIKGYLPVVISEKLFHQVNNRNSLVTPTLGRSGTNVNNLFTSLTKCKRCGASYIYINKGKWHYLACSNAKLGVSCTYDSYPYSDFESAFLKYFRELDINDLLDKGSSDANIVKNLELDIDVLKEKLDKNKGRIKNLMKKFADDDNSGECSELISEYKKENEQFSLRIKELSTDLISKKSFLTKSSDHLLAVQRYDDLSKSLSEDELYKLRIKLRLSIRQIVDRIDIKGKSFQIVFKNGVTRFISEFVVAEMMGKGDFKVSFPESGNEHNVKIKKDE